MTSHNIKLLAIGCLPLLMTSNLMAQKPLSKILMAQKFKEIWRISTPTALQIRKDIRVKFPEELISTQHISELVGEQVKKGTMLPKQIEPYSVQLQQPRIVNMLTGQQMLAVVVPTWKEDLQNILQPLNLEALKEEAEKKLLAKNPTKKYLSNAQKKQLSLQATELTIKQVQAVETVLTRLDKRFFQSNDEGFIQLQDFSFQAEFERQLSLLEQQHETVTPAKKMEMVEDAFNQMNHKYTGFATPILKKEYWDYGTIFFQQLRKEFELKNLALTGHEINFIQASTLGNSLFSKSLRVVSLENYLLTHLYHWPTSLGDEVWVSTQNTPLAPVVQALFTSSTVYAHLGKFYINQSMNWLKEHDNQWPTYRAVRKEGNEPFTNGLEQFITRHQNDARGKSLMHLRTAAEILQELKTISVTPDNKDYVSLITQWLANHYYAWPSSRSSDKGERELYYDLSDYMRNNSSDPMSQKLQELKKEIDLFQENCGRLQGND